MRTVILMLLLAGVSGSAAAAWVELGRDEPEALTVYTDPTTIRKADNIVKMWVLFDYKTARAVGRQTYRSERAQQEYDCKEERVRALCFTDHSENMAKGAVVFRISMPGDWAPVERGSVNEILEKAACGTQ